MVFFNYEAYQINQSIKTNNIKEVSMEEYSYRQNSNDFTLSPTKWITTNMEIMILAFVVIKMMGKENPLMNMKKIHFIACWIRDIII